MLNGTGPNPTTISGPRTYPTLSAGSTCVDTDEDGLPDAYEDAHGLNKHDAADASLVEADGYTHLEHYLNGQ
jgi:hypothetical protein